jgi:succinoglycan biosynthesis protein ExoO
MPTDISVIIAAYNAEKYIERAIRSALDQESVSVEVIVIDDNSTDGTPATIARINDPRVTFISLSVNSGPSVSRNTGIAAASAPWIAILDSDDMFLQGRLARCLLRAKMLDADIVVDNLVARRVTDKAEYPMFPPASFSRIGVLTLERFTSVKRFFPGGRTSLGYLKPVFRAEFLRQHGLCYDPALRIGEDYLLMCEALASGPRCAVEPEAGYLYTVLRAGSLTSRLTLADVDRMAEGDKKFLARYKLSPAAARMQRRQEYDLKEYYAYAKLADALKRRDVKGALKAAVDRPLITRHLWQPARRRAERLFKNFRARYLTRIMHQI